MPLRSKMPARALPVPTSIPIKYLAIDIQTLEGPNLGRLNPVQLLFAEVWPQRSVSATLDRAPDAAGQYLHSLFEFRRVDALLLIP
jgi:hypothetical protein